MKIRRACKYFWQRITRGWSDKETWSLDHSLSKLIAPRLKRLRDITITFPATLSEEEWHSNLNKMIAAFEWYGSETRWMDNESEKIAEHQEGLDLFAKFYSWLWW